MIIADSSISLQSNHNLVEKYSHHQSLTVWTDEAREEAGGTAPKTLFSGDAVSLSQQELSAELRQVKVEQAPAELTPIEDLNVRILKALFEKLFGKKIRLPHLGDLAEIHGQQQEAEAAFAPGAENPAAGWGLIYHEYSSYHEAEQLEFAAQGIIQTADGRELEVELSLNMSREFYTEQERSVAMGDALKDPLVVNFSGEAAELTQSKFSFDIDADGMKDQISFVGPRSGFLALDSNGDGEINDGTELFGAVSGDGFAELSAHDADANGWIDEGDAIFSRLRIWTKDAQGQDQLFALGQKGIGALYLGNIASPFSITTESNQLQGQLRSSGIFLHEEGGAGSLQQLDLVV
ncbi:hypothetical protein [Desulfogranum mediterraneum]|uniref:hypothetical protein n=1 Tax=Desulfogranum mediterraneum TaxID=160661 RepID=UPI0003F9E494|nr:hypothetical protein [Desulfogranum mediterraneum]